MARQFADSEIELVRWFTTSISLAAQRYDSDGQARPFDPDEAHEALQRVSFRRELAWYEGVRPTINAHAGPGSVLRKVYEPHRWGSELLEIALGRVIGIASMTAAATKATATQTEARPLTLLRYLEVQAGSNNGRLMTKVRREAEAIRDDALALYDASRLTRIATERREKAGAARERTRRVYESIRCGAIA